MYQFPVVGLLNPHLTTMFSALKWKVESHATLLALSYLRLGLLSVHNLDHGCPSIIRNSEHLRIAENVEATFCSR